MNNWQWQPLSWYLKVAAGFVGIIVWMLWALSEHPLQR